MRRSDRHVENARMNPENQAWQPLDPAAGSLPGEIESALSDGGSVSACVVILADSEIDRDWGAQASLAVAKRWAASGRRIILADACLDGPVLHEAVGVANGEGVSDMVLYGASAQRITERVEDGLMLAPAGTPVTQVAEVLEHVKWDMVIRGCKEAGATLVFYVSTGTPGVEAVTKRAEGVLVLAPRSKDVDAILGSESGPLIAVLGPPNGHVDSDHEGGDVASVDVLPGLPISEAEKAFVGEPSAEPPISEAEKAFVGEPPAEPPISEAERALVGEPPAEPPIAEAETALVGEPSAEPPEDEAPMAFSTDDLLKTTDAFSLSGLKGAQYDPVDSPEVELDPGQAPPSQPDEVEMGASLDVEPAAVVDDGEESAADVQSTGASMSDVDDLAVLDLEVADSADSGSGAAVGLGDPAPASDAPAELDVEESPEEVGVKASPSLFSAAASPAALGVEASRTEEREEAAEEEGKARRGYRGLARLKRKKRRDLFVRLMLIVIATAAVVGGGFYAIAYSGLIDIPGITPVDRVTSYVAPPVTLPGPTPQTAIMSHVLLVDLSFETESPLGLANALRGQLPNLLFFVAPLEVDGRLQFALYAGPAYSVEEANALRDPIVAVLERGRTLPMNPDDLSVHEAPYAFYFGEYPAAVNAQGRVDALAEASIPAYALQVAFADGSTRVRVYGGAFSDEIEAEEMGRMINRADIGALLLTPRRGTLPGGTLPE